MNLNNEESLPGEKKTKFSQKSKKVPALLFD
jgi:hypothetical protein